MALWALQAAPLLIGADLSKIDEWTTNILGNREMLAVNQDILGKPAARKMSDGWVEVWARPLEDGTIAAGLFNRGAEAATVTATWADLGLTDRSRCATSGCRRISGASTGSSRRRCRGTVWSS